MQNSREKIAKRKGLSLHEHVEYKETLSHKYERDYQHYGFQIINQGIDESTSEEEYTMEWHH